MRHAMCVHAGNKVVPDQLHRKLLARLAGEARLRIWTACHTRIRVRERAIDKGGKKAGREEGERKGGEEG